MGILDDAIREHLDLKRKHGAHDADLREIEDEAFGSTDRPDAFAANELFSEVSSTGLAEGEAPDAPAESPGGIGDFEAPGGLSEPDVGGEEPTRLVGPEALRPSEPPSEEPSSEEPSLGESPLDPTSLPEGAEQIPGQTEVPGQGEIPGQERLEDPLEGYRRSEPSQEEPSEHEPA